MDETKETIALLARRIASLEADREQFEQRSNGLMRDVMALSLCAAWLQGHASDREIVALGFDEEALEIIADRASNEVYGRLQRLGLAPAVQDD
jgi:hypothetical protein